MWSGIWSVATAWIWPKRHCGLGQEVVLILILEKLNSFRLTGLITLVIMMWKWMGLFLRKNQILRCCGWFYLPNWIGAITLSLLLELHPKIGALIHSMKFFLLRLLCISININQSYDTAWNTVIKSGLVLLVATWNFRISYKNG